MYIIIFFIIWGARIRFKMWSMTLSPYIFREWKQGLLPVLLNKFCVQPAPGDYEFSDKPTMKLFQLDGKVN